MFERKGVEAMKEDDELEMLLGEIPHATSSLNLHPANGGGSYQQSSVVDLGYGGHHAPYAVQRMGVGGGVYDAEILRRKYACAASSPLSGFSLQSEGSSSSLFSGGGCSMSDIGSPSPPQFEELRNHLGGGFWLDFEKESEGNLLDDFNLRRSFSKMSINDENCVQSCDRSVNVDKYAVSERYQKGFPDCVGFNPMNFEGNVAPSLLEMQRGDLRVVNFPRSRQSDGLFGNSTFSPQFYRANVGGSNNFPRGFAVPDAAATLNRQAALRDTLLYASRNGMTPVSPNAVQLARLVPRYGDENVLHCQPPLLPYGRNKVPLHVQVPQGNVEDFAREDSLIIQGEGVNYGVNRGRRRAMGHNVTGLHQESFAGSGQEKRAQLDSRVHVAAAKEGCKSPKMFFPFSLASKCSSLVEMQGYIFHMTKDQHGCRFLQRMFDEGTPTDRQIIFNEIIDHVDELMMNPFGNYLMQKLLEKCNEEQRLHILLRVTEEPGELVRISLNTHGTRVVQKLIETLKTAEEKSLVVSALEPGFLTLIKDLNGNHVIQRCLLCFSSKDSEFIFLAAAKYCVDIATHQHGCCVLQRCISHSDGEFRDNLIAEISLNGLQLAQDAYGNYVVQYILETESPSATAKLTSQFEGNFVHLSMQKFSSHVVEKCLTACEVDIRSKIINELLSAPYFEQLLQDPHANYVVQTALRVSEGPLFNALASAVESYKAISRNSPYSKRIFSHKLLKR